LEYHRHEPLYISSVNINGNIIDTNHYIYLL